MSQDKQALAVKLYDEKKHTLSQICEMMGISKPTLYKYIEAARGRLTKGAFSFGPSERGGEQPQ